MLGKLLKNEIKSYGFSMGITFLAALVITLLMKVMCMLPYHSDFKMFVQTITSSLFYYVSMAVVFAAQILVVVRFYTTMVGDRGYLTWTLPAKSSTILWSKLIGGGLWYFLSVIVVMLCLVLFFVGSYWDVGFEVEMMRESFGEMFAEIAEVFEILYIIPIILYILSCIVFSFIGFMMFYFCIAIGQMFGKWRILASIGTYFALMFITYIASIIIMIVSMGGVFVLEDFVEQSPFLFITMLMLVLLLASIAIFAGIFAITNRIFAKHLNLE